MTEATLTRELLKVLERKLPGAVVIKHADRFTAGIPDASLTWAGTTSWLEVKYVRRNLLRTGDVCLAPLRRQFPTIQLIMMERLAAAGSAVYLVYFDRLLTLWHPAAVGASVRQQLLIGPARTWSTSPNENFYARHHATQVSDDAELVAFFHWLHEARYELAPKRRKR